MGFFGRTLSSKKGVPPQPRWQFRVNIHEALRSCRRELDAWNMARLHENVPLFGGGLADSWPAWAVDAIGIARIETAHISAFLRHREREEAGRV